MRGRFGLTVSACAALFTIFCCFLAHKVSAEIVCADDIVPEGMAITATGTTATCEGACRARETQAVCGPLMKICSGQPIPKGYVVDSVTTMPACRCLSPEDNAYVIRYIGTEDGTNLSQDPGTSSGDSPYVQSEDTPSLDSENENKLSLRSRYPYGDPPFGNLLCSKATEYQADSNSNRTSANGSPPPGGALPQQPAPPPSWNYPASSPAWDYPASPPVWDYQPDEPFRVGQ